MKKFFALILILMLTIAFLYSCSDELPSNGDNYYKLTVIDYWGYLIKPLDEYYKAGEEVEVTLAFLSGPSVGIELNFEENV